MLPDKINWDEIKILYEKARACLWGPKHASQWSRDEDNGMYYLWSAYHYAAAADAERTDHLTYARIMEMMAHEFHYKISDYERFHKFVVPSVQEYEKAAASGQKPGDKEYVIIKWERDALDYKLKHESGDDWDNIAELIENGELFNKTDFEFHDSKPVFFKQVSDKQAILKLNYNHLLAVLRFDNVDSIDIHTDPVTNWVMDAYCYRMQNSKTVIFNAGDYTITSECVVLEKIVDFDEYAQTDSNAYFEKDGEKYGFPAAYDQKKYPGILTKRQKKALSEAEKKPASIDRIIKLTNELLMAAGIQPVHNSKVDGRDLRGLLEGRKDDQVYMNLLKDRDLKSPPRLIWMRFTNDGHLGVVASRNDINFDEDTDSYKVIHPCGLKWDESFVLVFPLNTEVGRYDELKQNERHNIHKVETAVGNYLIANGVPILDYYSHNYF